MTELFERLCADHLGFLEDEFGFRKVRTRRSGFSIITSHRAETQTWTRADPYELSCTFSNRTTAVEARLEPKELHLRIILYRLVDGGLPVYESLEDYDSDPSNTFDLDDLISLRAPHLRIEQPFGISLNDEHLRTVLTQYARALRECAKDVLFGDFQVFAVLGAIMEARREAHMKVDR